MVVSSSSSFLQHRRPVDSSLSRFQLLWTSTSFYRVQITYVFNKAIGQPRNLLNLIPLLISVDILVPSETINFLSPLIYASQEILIFARIRCTFRRCFTFYLYISFKNSTWNLPMNEFSVCQPGKRWNHRTSTRVAWKIQY